MRNTGLPMTSPKWKWHLTEKDVQNLHDENDTNEMVEMANTVGYTNDGDPQEGDVYGGGEKGQSAVGGAYL